MATDAVSSLRHGTGGQMARGPRLAQVEAKLHWTGVDGHLKPRESDGAAEKEGKPAPSSAPKARIVGCGGSMDGACTRTFAQPIVAVVRMRR